MSDTGKTSDDHVRRGFPVRVTTDRVTLPNGTLLDLDVVRHPGASAVVPFLSEREVLLIRQHRHAAGGMILEVPAGKLDDGEAPADCAHRELREEAGQRCARLETLGWIWTTPGFCDEKIHLFAGFDLSPVPPRPEDDEIIELVPMSLDHALARVWSGEINDAKTALALLHADRFVGRMS
ncbi:MAG: NUDIX hydrolase [Myxococcota bacterium]